MIGQHEPHLKAGVYSGSRRVGYEWVVPSPPVVPGFIFLAMEIAIFIIYNNKHFCLFN
jgi:hypothetical protein